MHSSEATATVRSVNVSGPLRNVPFAGQMITTGFFKTAVSGVSNVGKLGISGDAQGDLAVHGGPQKAVYFYPKEHYAAWELLLGSAPLAPGSFGENITSAGLLEQDVFVGDVLEIGTATLQILQPRSPCYKLQIRFGRPDMTALFFRQSKPGWYASVLQEGSFAAGDQIKVSHRASQSISIADIWRLSAEAEVDRKTADRIMKLRLLPDFWKQRIERNVMPVLR